MGTPQAGLGKRKGKEAMPQAEALKIAMTIAVILVAYMAGGPVLRRAGGQESRFYGMLEALAAGVFLGAGLIHMLGDADGEFTTAGLDYPWAFTIAGGVLLLLLWFEHWGRRASEAAEAGGGRFMALLATAMLGVHSFLVGGALGTSSEMAMTLIIFVAVLAHKWAASFALALELTRSTLSRRGRWWAFSLFVLLFAFGVVAGAALMRFDKAAPLAEPVFSSLAAGTFLFFGTLHELDQAPLIAKSGRIGGFLAATAGFVLMAIVAVWT